MTSNGNPVSPTPQPSLIDFDTSIANEPGQSKSEDTESNGSSTTSGEIQDSKSKVASSFF